MFKRALLIMAMATFALTASAGETDKLPEGVLAHASTKSLQTTVANLDAYIASCVKDTPTANQYQPGMLSMMLAMFSPLPAGAWDAKAELHAMAVTAEPMNPQPVFIIKTTGLAKFKKALASSGAKIEGDDKKMSVFLPKLDNTWFFIDLGGDRMAGSVNETACAFLAKTIAAGWSPKPAGKSDLSLNLDVKNLLSAYKPAYDAGMESLRQQVETAGENLDHVPEATRPLAGAMCKMFLKIFDKMEEEIPTVANFYTDLSFDAEQMRLAFSLAADAGSDLDTLRAAYAGGGQPKYTLAKSFPGESVLVGGISDMSALPKGLIEFYADMLHGVAQEVMPDRAGELAELPLKFMDLDIKEYVLGSYMASGRSVFTSYFECGKPKEFLALLPKAVELGQEYMNNVIKMSGQENAMSIDMGFEANAGKVDGVPYSRLSVRLNHAGGGASLNYDSYIAVGRKTITAVYGAVDESDLGHAISNFKEASGAFMQSEEVQNALAGIENRQLKFAAIRPLAALVSLYIGKSNLLGTNADAAREAADEIQFGSDCLALGAGATDRLLTSQIAVPAAVIGDFIRNAKAIESLKGDLMSDGEEKYYDDPEEPGDENSYFDDPAHDADAKGGK